MTSEEIRKRSSYGPIEQKVRPHTDDLIGFLTEMVGEVAAQLAELNEKLMDLNISVADAPVPFDRNR